jgi:hypothetical protein
MAMQFLYFIAVNWKLNQKTAEEIFWLFLRTMRSLPMKKEIRAMQSARKEVIGGKSLC